ncbi:hypothetical protein K466DRAFT_586327 [Polyporus arcularius HHB13444]|uniref:DUF6533 domain-containing protein n=1 Tax=Polyporus arcularius HHB13444 TaxID=1314778 RepID=A0A5C3PCP6_9APHY|nr:hypothetical protein K466DRAFT_586327 [Polyporus arcularius HHB13444]
MSADVVPQPVHIHNYLHLVGVVILYYDFTLTFGEEYWRIWKAPRSMSSFLFFLNRYLPVLGDIAVNVGNFYIFPTELGCRHYAFFRQLLLIVNQVVVCYILFLRTFALYGRDWRVGGSIFGFAMILLGISCWSIVGQHEDVELRGGCHLAADRMTAHPTGIAVSWESLFLFDLTIFSLTLFKTLQARRRNPVTIGRNDILSLVMRDGSSSQPHPLLRGCLSTAASSLSVTMMSRLMLNLHGSVSGREIVTTPISDSSGPSDNSTSLLFTTRISMPPISMIATTSDQEAARYRDRESAYVRDARAGYDHGYIEEVYEMQDTHYRDRDDTPLQVSAERRLGGDANDKRGW